MNITRESLSNLEYRVKIEIAESDYAEKVTKQLKNYKSRVQVPGFRKGMAPMSMIQRMYKSAVTADEVQNILNENLFKYIDDEKLNVVGSPLANDELTGTPDFEKGKDFTFYFDIAVMPEVNIDWSKIDVKMAEVKVDKKEIDTQIENITRQHGKFESPETIAETDYIYGRAVELDKEGNEKEGGMNVFCSFEVSSVKDEEIRNSFIGKKKDDKVRFAANKAFKADDIERNFRLDPEVAKKFKSEVELTISGASRVTPHEVNDELFKMVFPDKEIKDAAAFRKALAADLEASYKENCDVLFANQVRKQLMDNFDAEIPEAFLKRWMLTRGSKEITAEKLEVEWADVFLPSMKWEFIEYALQQIKPLNPSHIEVVDEIKSIIKRNTAAKEDTNDEEIERTANSIANDQQSSRQIQDRIYHRNLVSLFREKLNPETEKITVKEYNERIREDKKQA